MPLTSDSSPTKSPHGAPGLSLRYYQSLTGTSLEEMPQAVRGAAQCLSAARSCSTITPSRAIYPTVPCNSQAIPPRGWLPLVHFSSSCHAGTPRPHLLAGRGYVPLYGLKDSRDVFASCWGGREGVGVRGRRHKLRRRLYLPGKGEASRTENDGNRCPCDTSSWREQRSEPRRSRPNWHSRGEARQHVLRSCP